MSERGKDGTLGEKGNAVAGLGAAAPDLVGRVSTTVTEVVTGTATQVGDVMRDKIIAQGADHALDEMRDRLRERREAEAEAAGDEDVPDPGPPSS